MPPAGIEPTLQAPQACVLSVERRGLKMSGLFALSKTYSNCYWSYLLTDSHSSPHVTEYLKILKIPADDGRVILQGVLRVTVQQEYRQFLQPLQTGAG